MLFSISVTGQVYFLFLPLLLLSVSFVPLSVLLSILFIQVLGQIILVKQTLLPSTFPYSAYFTRKSPKV